MLTISRSLTHQPALVKPSPIIPWHLFNHPQMLSFCFVLLWMRMALRHTRRVRPSRVCCGGGSDWRSPHKHVKGAISVSGLACKTWLRTCSKYPMIQIILPPNPAPEKMPSPALLQQGSEHTSDTRFKKKRSARIAKGQNTSSKYIVLCWVIHVERFSTRLNSPKVSKRFKKCQVITTVIGIPKDNRTPLIGRVF